jgi:hypothetical protein
MRSRAWRAGILDGWEQPDDLTSGLTYDNPGLSEAYDRGANIGQARASGGSRVGCCRSRDPQRWTDAAMNGDLVQFARLLSEIRAVGLAPDQIQGLCASMDLSSDELSEMLARAEIVWERVKGKHLRGEVKRAGFEALRRMFADVEPRLKSEDLLLLYMREECFRFFDGVPRFQPIEPGEVPGLGRLAFRVGMNVPTEQTEMMVSECQRWLEKRYPGIVVTGGVRSHVGKRESGETCARLGMLVVCEWQGLRVTREFAA